MDWSCLYDTLLKNLNFVNVGPFGNCLFCCKNGRKIQFFSSKFFFFGILRLYFLNGVFTLLTNDRERAEGKLQIVLIFCFFLSLCFSAFRHLFLFIFLFFFLFLFLFCFFLSLCFSSFYHLFLFLCLFLFMLRCLFFNVLTWTEFAFQISMSFHGFLCEH